MTQPACILPTAGSFAIDPKWTINDLLACAPASAPVLNAFGIDTCCGGGAPIATAAAEAGITVEELTGAIADAISYRANSRR